MAPDRRAFRNRSTPCGAPRRFSPNTVAEATDNKFQIQVFAAGEIVPGLAGARRGAERHRRDAATPRPTTTSARIRPSRWICAVPFGLNTRQQNAWHHDGGGMDLMNDFYKKFNVVGMPAGNTGVPDGRLVPQGDQDVDDLNGLEDAHRRLRRRR